MTFELLIDWLGTFAFAVSGIRLAAAKNFDWFGAYVVGLITAVGGGTLRDLLLGLPVFWLWTPNYIIVCVVALLFTMVFKKHLCKIEGSIFAFDALGIGFFNVIGIDKALVAGTPVWAAVVLGMITAVFGGVIRDMTINEEPLILRKEIYATACLFGGVIYVLLQYVTLPHIFSQIIAIVLVIVIRILAVRFNWSLRGV